jgi:hypothetical protein
MSKAEPSTRDSELQFFVHKQLASVNRKKLRDKQEARVAMHLHMGPILHQHRTKKVCNKTMLRIVHQWS